MSDITTETQEQTEGGTIEVDERLLEATIDVVRPRLQADGGDCVYKGVDENGVVSLELTGACAGCPLSTITVQNGIERILRENVPGVTRVQTV